MTLKEAQDLIDDIYKFRADKLSEWEDNFCQSIYYSNYKTLTEKQDACLNKIFDKLMK